MSPKELIPESMAKLETKVPRYLFRALTSEAGKRGMSPVNKATFKDLNTVDAIVPCAFVTDPSQHTIYDIANVYDMVYAHTDEEITSPNPTEFSSWSQSLLLVLTHAYWQSLGTVTSVSIGILNTHQPTNAIIRLPDLLRFFGPPKTLRGVGALEDERHLPHEYLIHEIVVGPCYTAIPFESIVDDALAIYPQIGEMQLRSMKMGPSVFPLSEAWGDDVRDECWLEDGKPTYENIAQKTAACERLGEKLAGALESSESDADADAMVVRLAVTVLSVRRRWSDKTIQRGSRADTLEAIVRGLGNVRINWKLLEDEDVVGDILRDSGMPEVQQMVQTLKSLVAKYGSGETVELMYVDILDHVIVVEEGPPVMEPQARGCSKFTRKRKREMDRSEVIRLRSDDLEYWGEERGMRKRCKRG